MREILEDSYHACVCNCKYFTGACFFFNRSLGRKTTRGVEAMASPYILDRPYISSLILLRNMVNVLLLNMDSKELVLVLTGELVQKVNIYVKFH